MELAAEDHSASSVASGFKGKAPRDLAATRGALIGERERGLPEPLDKVFVEEDQMLRRFPSCF